MILVNVVKVPQVPAVPRLLVTSISWSQDWSVLQDGQWVCVGVSYDTRETAAAEREEGDAERTEENSRQNDCRGLGQLCLSIATWLMYQWTLSNKQGARRVTPWCCNVIYMISKHWLVLCQEPRLGKSSAFLIFYFSSVYRTAVNLLVPNSAILTSSFY